MKKLTTFWADGIEKGSLLSVTPSDTPSANIGSPAGSFGSSSSPQKRRKTRRRAGEEKIEAIARELIKRSPKRFKTFAQAMAYVTEHNIEKSKDIYTQYCIGADSYLTDEEFIERQENGEPSATQAILKGCEAAPGKDFAEKLQKVLKIWPDLAEEWRRER